MSEFERCEVGELRPIQHRYLLVLHIPVYRDRNGVRWTDPLWAKDLLRHLDYLSDFTLASPCFVEAPPAGFTCIDDQRIRFVDLPSRRKSTLGLPRMIRQLWRSIGRTEVVHTGLGGWLPVSIGNLTALMAILRRRYLVIIVESSPWRLVPGETVSLSARLRASVAEWINRQWLTRVNFAVFTHESYKRELMPSPRSTQSACVIHASWIDAEDVLSDEEAARSWSAKRQAGLPGIRLLFAGRLTAAKGVIVLIEALKRFDSLGRDIEVAILGTGELLDTCRDAAHSLRHVSVKLLEPVAYGPTFFQLVRRYHAVVVPSLTDEQPRIVYDAFSQAVPVLACNTDGLRDCVEDGRTGRLCQPNDPDALCSLLYAAASEPLDLERLGIAGLQTARSLTHQGMHYRRWALLQSCLPARQG